MDPHPPPPAPIQSRPPRQLLRIPTLRQLLPLHLQPWPRPENPQFLPQLVQNRPLYARTHFPPPHARVPVSHPDPNLATAVFLPYYAGLDGLKYLFGPEVNSSFRHGLDLFEYITNVDNPSIWNKNLGHDHFLVMARPAWDFSQPLSNNPPIFGSSFLELPEFFNITALTLEARAYSWQEQAIPYPTSFHPPNLAFYESWVNRVKKSRRSTLMLFAGGGGISANPNVRRSIRLECENVTSMSTNGTGYAKFCDFVDCSNGICEHDPIKFMKPMLQSSFCLQPPGTPRLGGRRSMGSWRGAYRCSLKKSRRRSSTGGTCRRRTTRSSQCSYKRRMWCSRG
ncbi:UNVERIFIED_CONTAM: putative xyloglucan galactosyltransferase GT19 [Sesamum angustifolium]|uniref:Xyloglucan galactosyltransferase GT19 n=1 Tax=Sesamum angustifolium TaxID=2727405 RepID=A0AAW2MJ92_9LAMI